MYTDVTDWLTSTKTGRCVDTDSECACHRGARGARPGRPIVKGDRGQGSVKMTNAPSELSNLNPEMKPASSGRRFGAKLVLPKFKHLGWYFSHDFWCIRCLTLWRFKRRQKLLKTYIPYLCNKWKMSGIPRASFVPAINMAAMLEQLTPPPDLLM